VGQELLTLPKYLSYVGIAPSLVFCVVFGPPLYCLFLFFFSLYCLSFELITTSDYTFGICFLCRSTIVLFVPFLFFIVLSVL
jgi:Gpi18-like mannosyltransferase